MVPGALVPLLRKGHDAMLFPFERLMRARVRFSGTRCLQECDAREINWGHASKVSEKAKYGESASGGRDRNESPLIRIHQSFLFIHFRCV